MSHILTARDEGVLTLTMNRPDKKNALTAAMYAALADGLADAEADAAIRAVVITGSGGIFTSGNDVQDFLMNPPKEPDAPVFRFLKAIATASKPLVAAVPGIAVGVGMTMLLHCDLVYAADSAKLSVPFVNLALVPEAASSLLLPNLVGHQRAAELFLLGEAVTAADAQRLGLVNRVFADTDLANEVGRVARALAQRAPSAVKATKALMKPPAETVLARMTAEAEIFQRQLTSADAREAFSAFLEKRPPKFA